MGDITPADIELLTRELNLKETTPTTLHALTASFGRDWFRRFKAMNRDEIEVEDEKTGKVKKVPHPDSVAAWADEAGVNVMAAEALHDKLRRLFDKEYIVEKPAADAIGEIIKSLEAGKHVILSFGQAYETDLDYLLVSNLLTRKIKQVWENKTNAFRSSGKDEPRQLVIVVEEAHKLLNREMAGQTTFASIAREMRKYYVTLLIIDQRPSQIYDEVHVAARHAHLRLAGRRGRYPCRALGPVRARFPARHAGAPAAQGGSAPAGLGRPDAPAGALAPL